MNNYVVIDIETSGINPDKDEIIRLSALSIVNGNEAGTFFKLVKPIKPLTEEIEILTGITNVDLKEKCGIIDLLPDFLNFIGDSVLVAHNIGFDIKFINVALKKANMPSIKNETVDTFSIARNKLLLQKYTLKHVAEFLGVCGNADEEIIFAVYEKLKTLPARMLTSDEMSYLEDLRQNSNECGISQYIRIRRSQAYFDELRKVPFEDIESLCGEELETFNISMALDWVKIQGGDGNDQERMSEKYEKYLNGLSKTDREYVQRVARVRGDCKGADCLIQKFLVENGYQNVVVYFSGERARINIGDWEEKQIGFSKCDQGYELYKRKDEQMALDADAGFMVLNGATRGTMANIERLIALKKECRVAFPDKTERAKRLNAPAFFVRAFAKDKDFQWLKEYLQKVKNE